MGAGASASIVESVSACSQDDLSRAVSSLSQDAAQKLRAAIDGEEQAQKNTLRGIVDSGTLVQAKSDRFNHASVNVTADKSDQTVSNLAELLKMAGEDHNWRQQMHNSIKICGACGKVNAYTLADCNSCGTELPATTTTSQNVFTSFIYGVGPFAISIRFQSPEILVFDDLMACTPCHLNAIPTDHYIPDWRFLLRRPTEALSLVHALHRTAASVLKDQFWQSETWRQTIFHQSAQNISGDEVVQHAVAGFNFPPSQFQLHLQYMLPPFVPYQMQMISEGKGFLFGRFFPFKYIIAVLEKAADGHNLDAVDTDLPAEKIISHFDALGISYADMHAEFCKGVHVSQNALANWRPEDFELRLKNGKLLDAVSQEAVEGDVVKVLQADKCILQNYGRPYDADGKPFGTFYKYAKNACVPEF